MYVDWDTLQGAIAGEVVLPGAPGYELARKPSEPLLPDVRPVRGNTGEAALGRLSAIRDDDIDIDVQDFDGPLAPHVSRISRAVCAQVICSSSSASLRCASCLQPGVLARVVMRAFCSARVNPASL